MIVKSFLGIFTFCLCLVSIALSLAGLKSEDTLIAYTETDSEQQSRIMLLDVETGMKIDVSSDISEGNLSAQIPRWSADGEHIAFWTYPNRRDAYIYELSLKDYQPDNLTETWGYLSLPIFAPSGELGFSDSPRYDKAPFYVTDSQANTSTLFIENLVGEPQWSSDGRYFAYLSETDLSLDGLVSAGEELASSEIDLYIMNTATKNISNLTATIVGAGVPSWSPDNKYIAFIPIVRPAGVLHIIDIETGEISYPTDSILRSKPLWSSNGKYLTFVYATSGNLEIGVLELESNQLRNISNHPSYDLQPTWSPDSQQVIFVSGRNGQDDLYIYDIESDNLRRLTFTAEKESDPTWRP